MIFQHTWRQVIDGTKTQTRRLVKPGEMVCDSPFRYTDKNEDGIEFLNPGVYKVTWFEGQESFDDGDGECKDLRMVYGFGFHRMSSWGPGEKWPATYAVQPGRGKPAIWIRPNQVGGLDIYMEAVEWRPAYVPGEPTDWDDLTRYDHRPYLLAQGWREARIRITAIRREPLQSITEADARAEGVESVDAYRELWDRINGKAKGARWNDNPAVWVLTFELVKDGAK